jgi:trehalose utilization protein
MIIANQNLYTDSKSSEKIEVIHMNIINGSKIIVAFSISMLWIYSKFMGNEVKLKWHLLSQYKQSG